MEIGEGETSESDEPLSFRLAVLRGVLRRAALRQRYEIIKEECSPYSNFSPINISETAKQDGTFSAEEMNLERFMRSEMALLDEKAFGKNGCIILGMVKQEYGRPLKPSDIIGTCVLYRRTVALQACQRDKLTRRSLSSATCNANASSNYLTLNLPNPTNYLPSSAALYLSDFIIDKKYQGRGYGDLMFSLLKRFLYSHQVPLLTLFSIIGSPFYEKRGCIAVPNWQFQLQVAEQPYATRYSLFDGGSSSVTPRTLASIAPFLMEALKAYNVSLLTLADLDAAYDTYLAPCTHPQKVDKKLDASSYYNSQCSQPCAFEVLPTRDNFAFHYARRTFGLHAAFDAANIPQVIGLAINPSSHASHPSLESLQQQNPFWLFWTYDVTSLDKSLRIIAFSHQTLTPFYEQLAILVFSLLGRIATMLHLNTVSLWYPSPSSPLMDLSSFTNTTATMSSALFFKIMKKARFERIEPEEHILPLYYVPENSPLANIPLQWRHLSLLEYW
jgi:hypothetical protein